MLLPILFILIGFGLLIKGADWMVSGSSALARKYHISDLVIGLTIVAFGTSAPELVVNAFASIDGHSDIVLGNIIGSNNFNLFVILGIVGLISPFVVQTSTIWKEIPIALFAVLTMYFLTHNFYLSDTTGFSRIDGLVMLSMFAAFLYYIFTQMKAHPAPAETTMVQWSNIKIWTLIVIGLSGLVLGGKLVVDYAVELAQQLGVSEKIIGLTIVAAGTSLPELVTSVVAAMKKNSDMAVGNIIGSNIFNIFLILATSALIRPISYNPKFDFDLYLLLGGTLFLFIAMFSGQKKKLDRWEALIFVTCFVAYTIFSIVRE